MRAGSLVSAYPSKALKKGSGRVDLISPRNAWKASLTCWGEEVLSKR